MKEYLRAVRALKRVCDLVARNSDIPCSTVQFYIEDFETEFKKQFGQLMGAQLVIETLEQAKIACREQGSAKTVELLNKLNIFVT